MEAKMIPIWETITTAWDKTFGVKKSFWAALALVFLIGIGIGILQAIAKAISPSLDVVTKLLTNIVTYLLQIGLLYMGIQRAFDRPVNYKQIFFAFEWRRICYLIGVYLLQFIIFIPVIILIVIATVLSGDSSPLPGTGGLFLAALLFVAAIILGLYLIVRIMLGVAFVVDKDVNPWIAIKMSFQVTRNNVLNLIAINILQLIIVLVSIIPLFIGLIWTIPFSTICYGVIYKTLLQNNAD